MANKNKAKGTAAETRVVKFINEYEGLSAERLALHGSKDEGDIRIRSEKYPGLEMRLEVKSGEQTKNPTRTDLMTWLEQANAESANSGWPCALVVARHGKSPRNYDVYMEFTVSEPYRMIRSHEYLDEFCERRSDVSQSRSNS